MTTTGTPRPASRVPARRRVPWLLLGPASPSPLSCSPPLAFLLIQAGATGWPTLSPLSLRPLTAILLWNTVRLTVVVTALCAVIGTLAGLVHRAHRPARPPDVGGAAWWCPSPSPTSWSASAGCRSPPSLQGFPGAVLVMTLAVYPLVYLPVAASLRSADPGQEEVARSLGSGRVRTFCGSPWARPGAAILGGCVLVALVILAEYGAFEILALPDLHHRDLHRVPDRLQHPDRLRPVPRARRCWASVVLGGEVCARGSGRARAPARWRSAPGAPPAWAGRPSRRGRDALLVGLALGVPVGAPSTGWSRAAPAA